MSVPPLIPLSHTGWTLRAITEGGIRMLRLLIASLILAGALTPAPSATDARTAGEGFTHRVDNPWFPLKPGVSFVYEGTVDGEPARSVLTVTSRTIVIDGVQSMSSGYWPSGGAPGYGSLATMNWLTHTFQSWPALS